MLNTARKQHRIRLDNLQRLIAEAGSARRLAKLSGSSASYVCQVRTQRPTPSGSPRGIGDDLAARFEKAMGKPDGWMDEFHAGEDPAPVNAEPGPGAHGVRPLISWVQAGAWTDAADSFSAHDAEAWLPCPVRCSPDTFVLRVRGESMEPRFRDGDLIFVDPAVPPDHGRFVVVREQDTHEAAFRQLIVEGEQHYLKALNPDWPARIVQSNSTASICGVVVFKGEIV